MPETRAQNDDLQMELARIANPDTVAVLHDEPIVQEVAPVPGEPNVDINWADSESAVRGKQIVGIEFDDRHLVLVGIQQDGKQQRLNRLWVGSWEERPRVDDLARCLRDFVPGGSPVAEIVVSTSRGVVRRYRIPPLRSHRRKAAAQWEGAKLVPFPLNDENALYGFEFHSDGKRGWWVTLVAAPQIDAAPIIDAVTDCGWRIRKITLVGTQRVSVPLQPDKGGKSGAVNALVVTAWRRGSFTVFREGRVRFHYDMGPLSSPMYDARTLAAPSTPELLQASIDALQKAIIDALDFFGNTGPGVVPSHLYIIGLPEDAAPLITEWRDRFETGVVILDPAKPFVSGLSGNVVEWTRMNSGVLTPALMAALGGTGVDMTPAAIRSRETLHRLTQYARSAFILSFVTAIVWSALLWQHVGNLTSMVESVREKTRLIVESPTVGNARATLSSLEAHHNRQNVISSQSHTWMPLVKTLLSSVPEHGRLTRFELVPISATAQNPQTSYAARLDGSLAPGGPPHALVYQRWLSDLARTFGPNQAKLTSERTIAWKGRTRSVFVIEVIMEDAIRVQSESVQ